MVNFCYSDGRYLLWLEYGEKSPVLRISIGPGILTAVTDARAYSLLWTVMITLWRSIYSAIDKRSDNTKSYHCFLHYTPNPLTFGAVQQSVVQFGIVIPFVTQNGKSLCKFPQPEGKAGYGYFQSLLYCC